MGKESKNGLAATSAPAATTTEHKVSSLRTVLRSAPRKKSARSRSPLKAAVAKLLPDLLAFRAKGYSGAELAEIMRDNGFVISVGTLNKYVAEARTRSGNKRKKKTVTTALRAKTTAAESEARSSDAAKTIVVHPSLLATKTSTQNRRTAKDVLGHRFDDDL